MRRILNGCAMQSAMEYSVMNRTITTTEILIFLGPSIALAIVALVAAIVLTCIDNRKGN